MVSLVVVSGGGWSSVSSLLKRVCLSDNLSCSLGSLEGEEVRSFVANFFSDCSNDDTEDGNGRDGPSLRGKIARKIIYLPLHFSFHSPLFIGVDVSKQTPVTTGGVDSDGGPAD